MLCFVSFSDPALSLSVCVSLFFSDVLSFSFAVSLSAFFLAVSFVLPFACVSFAVSEELSLSVLLSVTVCV